MSLRLRKRWGPVRLAAETGVAPSTAGAVLRRCGISRLSRLERREQPVIRYEHSAPGELLHADVKKLGNIPDGGGWRFLGRDQGKANRIADGGRGRSRHHNPLMRHGFIHVVLDDHSRLAYAEIHDDETGATAAAVLRRAVAWFADRGVTTAPGAHRQRRLLPQPRLGHRLRRARHHGEEDPALPAADQRQGRTLQPHHDQRVGLRRSSSPAKPTAEPPFLAWLHAYNHHRPHTGIGGHPPISRLTNLPGQYI